MSTLGLFKTQLTETVASHVWGPAVVINSPRCCFLLHLELRRRRKHFLTISLWGCLQPTLPSIGSQCFKVSNLNSWLLPPQPEKEPTLLAISLDSGLFFILASEDFISFITFHFIPFITNSAIYLKKRFIYSAFSGILCWGVLMLFGMPHCW